MLYSCTHMAGGRQRVKGWQETPKVSITREMESYRPTHRGGVHRVDYTNGIWFLSNYRQWFCRPNLCIKMQIFSRSATY